MFKVGAFARLGRVSVKVLRHYDELGVLRPARVDPESGYRYYLADQLPRLHRIVALKELGFSLTEVRQLLEGEPSAEQMRGMLELKRVEIERRVLSERARLIGVEERLRQIAEADGWPAYDIAVRPLAPLTVAAIRARITPSGTEEDLFEEVEAYAARHDARAPSPPLLLCHNADARRPDIEVAVPIARPIPASDRVTVYELSGAADAACVVHAGSYATMPRAVAALGVWIAAQGYRAAGPLRAVYVRFGAGCVGYRLPESYLTREPAAYVTELQLPVRRNDERSVA